MAEVILSIIFLVPLYGMLLWSYFFPQESLLFGKRWMYKEEPEFSQEVIRYTKFSSLIAMIALPIVMIGFIFDILFLKFSIVIFLLIIIFGALKIFTDDF